jgi:hypothetical protein
MKPGISSTVMQHVLRMKKRDQGESSSVPSRMQMRNLSPQVNIGNIGVFIEIKKAAFGGSKMIIERISSSGPNAKHAYPIAPTSFGHGG